MRNDRGFVFYELVILVVLLALVGTFVFLYFRSQPNSDDTTPLNQESDTTWDKIKASGVLRIGITSGDLPWIDIDPETGSYVGAEVEIAEQLVQELGVEIQWVDTGWDVLIDDLIAQKFDVIMGGMSITDDRKELIDFSDPYYSTGQVIIVREGSEISNPGDLANMKVGVLAGTTSEDFAKTIPGAVVRSFDETGGEYFDELAAGNLDAVIYDGTSGYWYTQTNSGFTVVGDLLTEEDYGVGIRKGDAQVKQAINNAIAKIVGSDAYQESVKKWYEK